MSDDNQEIEKKKSEKRVAIEPGIYPNPDGTYDVRVSRRIRVSKHDTSKQHFKRRRKVSGLVNAQRLKKKFFDELSIEALKHKGDDIKWKVAREEYIAYLKKRNAEGSISPSTLNTITTTLEKHTKQWDDKWLSSFSADFIETFLTSDKLKNELESITRLTILKYIRGVFKRQIATGRIKHNPAMGILVRVDKKRRYPTVMKHEEILKLIQYTEGISPEWATIYKVAYLTGARSGELYALKWEDIDLPGRNIYIKSSYDWVTEKEKATKGKKDRTVPINDSLFNLLSLLEKKDKYVLPRLAEWRNGKAASVIRQYQEALGIKKSKFHAIRATFITNLLINGVAVIKVQAICGHDDLKTTLLYVGMLGEDTKNATNSLTLTSNVLPMEDFKKSNSK